jgi:hypothetical protein
LSGLENAKGKSLRWQGRVFVGLAISNGGYEETIARAMKNGVL